MHRKIDRFGGLLVDGFHCLALFAIGATIVWSAVGAFFDMAGKGHASIEDILLLFIYLELGAMVGIYFKTNHMPCASARRATPRWTPLAGRRRSSPPSTGAARVHVQRVE